MGGFSFSCVVVLSEMISRLERSDVEPDVALNERMVRALGRFGGVDAARMMFGKVKGLLRDVDEGVVVVNAWISVLMGYGRYDEALDIVKGTFDGKMGVKPDEETVLNAVDVYTAVGKYSGEELGDIVASWKERKLPVTAETYLRLISALGEQNGYAVIQRVVEDVLPQWTADPSEIFACAVEALAGADRMWTKRLIRLFTEQFPRKNWISELKREGR